MEKDSLINAIDFFNNLSLSVEDITTALDIQNNNKVVKATYSYKGNVFTTQPLYYKEITALSDVRDIKELHETFGDKVYWLDINRHKWPKGSGESDLDSLVISDMLPNKNDDQFRDFLLLLANNNQTGFIQKITKEGRPGQYYHNLENNNHWHDLVIWIKKTIKNNGHKIPQSYFQHLIFNWDKGKRTSLNLHRPYKIVRDLNKNIKSATSHMEIRETKKLLEYKKQIILQGPPGTGKTRKAKEIAAEMLGLSSAENLNSHEAFKLIQFHPSYTYEDFVRGITAKPNQGGEGILYEAENKTLGKFADKALENYMLSIDKNEEVKIDKWIEEKFEEFRTEIEAKLPEDELLLSGEITIYEVTQNSFLYAKNWKAASHIRFSDFKDLIKDVIEDKFQISGEQIPKENSLHAHYRYTYYNALLKKFFEKYQFKKDKEKQKEKKYILVIDEINRANLSSVLGELVYALEYRGDSVETLYEVHGKRGLTLPPNLYIIGTMNTADRSVGHIDYAIRRRFAFVPVHPEELQENGNIYFNTSYFKKVSALFNRANVSHDFKIEDVQIGHSYFIASKEEAVNEEMRNEIFRLKMNYEVLPLLQEYVTDGVLVGKFNNKNISEYIVEDLKI